MSSLSKAWENVKSVASGDKDLIDRKTFIGKLDLGGLRQWSKLTGGKDSRSGQLRRYGNMGAGAVGGAITGFATGGPVGAVLGAAGGGVKGYQDKDPVTGRNALQNAGTGALIGYGAGSISSALGSGGSGWTLGIGGGAKPIPTAGVNGVTSASSGAGNTMGMLSNIPMSGGESNEQPPVQQNPAPSYYQKEIERKRQVKAITDELRRKAYLEKMSV